MAYLTIYVPDDLAEDVRRHGVPISATCRAALTRKVRLRERVKASAVDGARAEGRRRYSETVK